MSLPQLPLILWSYFNSRPQPLTPLVSHLNLTSPVHNLTHLVSAFSLTVSHSHKPISSQAQAVAVADLTLSPHSYKPTALYSLNSISSSPLPISHYRIALCPSHLPRPWPHGLAPPRSPFFPFFLFFIYFLFFIFFSGSNLSQCEFVFVILKGKIIDLKFVFGLWFWKGKL